MVLRPAEHAATKIIKSSKCFVKSRRHELIFFFVVFLLFLIFFFFFFKNFKQCSANYEQFAYRCPMQRARMKIKFLVAFLCCFFYFVDLGNSKIK